LVPTNHPLPPPLHFPSPPFFAIGVRLLILYFSCLVPPVPTVIFFLQTFKHLVLFFFLWVPLNPQRPPCEGFYVSVVGVNSNLLGDLLAPNFPLPQLLAFNPRLDAVPAFCPPPLHFAVCSPTLASNVTPCPRTCLPCTMLVLVHRWTLQNRWGARGVIPCYFSGKSYHPIPHNFNRMIFVYIVDIHCVQTRFTCQKSSPICRLPPSDRLPYSSSLSAAPPFFPGRRPPPPPFPVPPHLFCPVPFSSKGSHPPLLCVSQLPLGDV